MSHVTGFGVRAASVTARRSGRADRGVTRRTLLGCLAMGAALSYADVYVVTSTSSSGAGTLRDALTSANAHAGLDTIAFSIAGENPAVIHVTTGLPQITSPVLIDGCSQPGSQPASASGAATIAVQVQGSQSFAGLRLVAGGCTVRGVAICGFSDGIVVSSPTGVTVEGTHIGVDASGAAALGNRVGIRLQTAGHTIGGVTPAARNVISGNAESGIEIDTGEWTSAPGQGSHICGNFIGPDAFGAPGLGNGECGVKVIRSADNMIGGTAPGAGNTIAHNGSAGVLVAHGVRNGVLSNAVFDNGGVGIDLLWDYWDSDPDGVNPNDAGDGDWGANDLQNFPVLTAAEVIGSSLRVHGTLNSLPATQFRVELFAVPSPDGSGYGEGDVYLGAAEVTTGADGIGAVDVTLPMTLAPGTFLSATATDPLNNTSEFGRCLSFQGSTVVTTALESGPGSLRNAMVTANLSPGPDTISFAIPGEGPHLIRVTSPLPVIEEQVVIDGYTQSGAVEASASSPAVLRITLDGTLLSGDASGLVISASGCTVRGLAVGGFPWCGILTYYCDSSTISGNHLGVDASGTETLASAVGLYLDAGEGAVVGGALPGARNVISGNALAGLVMAGSADTAIGNYIGTTAAGTAAMGNGIGVVLGGGEVLGGTHASARNIIAGSASHGVVLALSGNIVQQNWIGMLADGSVVGNGGVGVAVGARWLDGVTYRLRLPKSPPFAVDNAIRENVICGSTGLGIDLYPAGPGTNDTYDTDGGDNLQQNYPVLTQVYESQGQTIVSGSLASSPNTSFLIDFYADVLPDPSSFGEGLIHLGSTSVVTGADGSATVAIGMPPEALRGLFVCSTATDPQGNTSEFGPCIAVGGSGTVTTVADTGVGCLRYAISAANTSTDIDAITFAIPGTGPHVIRPLSPLPPLLRALTLDGYSQPGAQPATSDAPAVLAIELDGTMAGPTVDGITIQGAGAVAAGLIITGFSGAGIRVSGDGGAVRGSWIGLSGAQSSVGNMAAGILVEGSSVTIGGTTPASRNVIGGNEGDGISLTRDAAGASILGNYVGTDPSGTVAVPNGGAGIHAAGVSHAIGNGQPTGRNLIAGNGHEGIVIEGNATRIRGNFIGVDATGANPLGNGGHGVSLLAADSTIIGGEGQGDGNVIAANGGAGISVIYVGSSGNAMVRNLIGTDISRTRRLGNVASGVSIRGGMNTAIGGVSPELANTLAYNGGDGIEIVTGTGNTIFCNSIFDNAELGIDLGPTGVTANDPTDADGGANLLQNFPEVTTATMDSGGFLTVTGVLASRPNGLYALRFFRSDEADPSGYGEGASWVGETTVLTDQSGHAAFSCVFDVPVIPPGGSVVTAIATCSAGNSSEFSAAVPISGLPAQAPPAAVTFTLAPATPNPFRAATVIRFSLPSSQETLLSLYDIQGHLVRRLLSLPLPAGDHAVTWDGRRGDGSRAAPGPYVCRLEAGELAASRCVVVVR